MKLYLKNEHTGRRYEIISIDKDAGTITLRGQHATFTEPYDKDRLKAMGYVLEREENDDA